MKYIRTEDENGVYEIFIFPRTVNHDAMAEVLSGIKNHTHGDWSRVRRVPISAGFVSSTGKCFGESESLSLVSFPEDTELLEKQYRG